ncbi:caspase-2-like isoform X2 [Belonocnema kinseyi]|uniref:caspase-2-like isoform X2 n=1 Tax=Belonocnema kinseyi TaxID=2817044 RepID=UPI00143D97EB|nr:caspase-2-like isoform X2 [Belonocnema kinseyi]
MNQGDREKINVSCERMVPQIDMTDLWPKLLQNRVFNHDDCNIPIWRKDLSNLETKRDILLTVRTRGPHAFKNFLLSLRQSGHENVANDLEAVEINSNVQLEKEVIPEDVLRLKENSEKNYEDEDYDEFEDDNPYFNRMLHTEIPLKIKVRKATKFLDGPVSGKNELERYIMRSKPRGFLLIICNIDYVTLNVRTGAEHDADNLQKLFEDMGFQVTLKRNLTGAEMRNAIKAFAARNDFHKVDSCFVIISSHGREAGKGADGEVLGTDFQAGSQSYEKIFCSEIVEYFTTANCPKLAGKPKVFIFQMCRGATNQVAVSRHATDGVVTVQPNFDEEETKLQVQLDRNYSDIIIAHATLPGYYAYRDTINGTWCIQVLCEVFMKEAYEKNLQDLFAKVDAGLKTLRTGADGCQTLTVTTMGFNKHCFLNPGLFEETL